MLISMTGYGSGTATVNGMVVSAEIRSVNNRFLDFSVRLPKSLQPKEQEIRELIRRRIGRGKVNLTVSIEREGGEEPPLSVDTTMAKAYVRLLGQLQKEAGVGGEITIDTLLRFSDVFSTEESSEVGSEEWELVREAVEIALGGLLAMKNSEGEILGLDLLKRIDSMEQRIDQIEDLSSNRTETERKRLHDRIQQILEEETYDRDRLELEIVLLADKLDITEELVRFRSHLLFFREALAGPESEGRKLGFLLQELNREANTIGSKANDASIAQLVVHVKEEIERIREQIQNVE